MLSEFCLVRHAETDWNRAGRLQGHTDNALNARGRAQALAAAPWVASRQWDTLVSSPLLRAQQTARILAEPAGLRLDRLVTAFVERDYGAASGLTPAERQARFVDNAVPGLESRESVAARALGALGDLCLARPGDRTLVITHGSLVKCLLLHLAPGLDPRRADVALVSATTLRWSGRTWTVHDIGAPMCGGDQSA